MEVKTPGIGDLITKGTEKYRILNIKENTITICDAASSSILIGYIRTDTLNRWIEEENASLTEKASHIIDETTLTQPMLEKYRRNKNIIRIITENYGPDYIDLSIKGRKEVVETILSDYGIDRATFWRIIRKYLQSGMDDLSLVDKKPDMDRSRKSIDPEREEMLRKFDYGIQYYKKKNGVSSLTASFEKVLQKYYPEYLSTPPSDDSLKNRNNTPTFRMYQYYANQVLTKKDKEIIKLGRTDYRNNKRVTLGSSETGVYEPYDMAEMDAVEFDVSLVDERDGRICVGRPIVYLMKDVLTRMILAVGIGFDNNSVVGCTNCFANLNEDKSALCREYGIKMEHEYDWLTGYKPRRIRVDNGSDFISNDIERICKDLNIQRDIVPPASGSLKGVVERSFADVHAKMNHFFEGYGHIRKKYDSKHHEEATLNIKEFTKMFYLYVLQYNTTVNTGIPLTRDMTEKGIPQIPAEAMRYYLTLITPQILPKGDEFLAILLKKDDGRLSGNGITFKNLRYMNFDDPDLLAKMEGLHKLRVKFPILYDPRSIDTVYYISNHSLIRAGLNLDVKAQYTYLGMTFISFICVSNTQK